ncbi:MAG: bile acid:sodium symporter [Geminicoccus sp.]|nr:bile acid:sodium symporter [Geminicoccus sp.]
MLANVVLPLVLAFIMFSLGIGLRFADFGRVFVRPGAVAVGLVAQMLILPVVAFVTLLFFDLPPAFKVGVMILSFVPGGTTSNMITRLARGDVALSVTLTAVVSIIFVVTLPILIPASVGHFQSAELGASIPVVELFLKAFLITAVPVTIGVLLRQFLPDTMAAAHGPVSLVATILFVVLVLAIIGTNLDVLRAQLPVLGPVLILLNVVMLAIGWFLARLSGLEGRAATTVALEAGVQNAGLGMAIGAILWASLGDGSVPDFSVYALPSAAYGVLMYFVAAPFVLWRFFANR